jgi:hypothetical protein
MAVASEPSPKVELFSPAWIELARGFLENKVAEAGHALDGVRFEICEVLTDPPAHLAEPGTKRVSWNVRFDGPSVRVRAGEIDCAFKMVADYRTVLPKARIVYGENPEALAAMREQAPAELPEVPKPLQAMLVEAHDFLARRTT